jgi:flagellar hook-length control protein FliK
VASVTPVQTSELRPNSPSPQAPKSGDPFAKLLDTASAKRPAAPEPRRRPESPDSPRVNGAEKPERPQPRQNAKPVMDKSKPAAPEANDCSTPEETTATEPKVEAKSTEENQPADAVIVETDVMAEEAVMLPVEGEASPDASAGEGETASDETAFDEAVANTNETDDQLQVSADTGAVITAEVPAQPVVQQALAPEATPVPAPVAAVEAAVNVAAEGPVAAVASKADVSAGKPTNPQTAATADAEAAVTGDESPQTAPQTAKPGEAAQVQKPVVSNHAETRDAVIAEKGEQTAQNTSAIKPDVPVQAKEHASTKPLEHVPAQSNVENSAPRQQVTPQTAPVMPEPVRALAGSLNPVNLRAANEGPNNSVQLNAQAIGVEIASRAKEGMRRFDIRIDPPELGRVDVRLEVGADGKTSLRLVVERPETLDLLQRDARNLERAMQSAGLQTDESGLEFSLRDHNQNSLADMDDGGGYDRRDEYLASAIEDAEQAPPALERYARSVFARGGVDIRI